MKTALCPLFLIITVCFCKAQSPYSEQPKIAVFDIDLMVRALPEYKIVDSLVVIYENDTLGTEYELLQEEYKRLDSIFLNHIDKLTGGRDKFLDSINERKKNLCFSIIYWQQYAQKKDSIKRRTLSDPLYKRVRIAFFKILS